MEEDRRQAEDYLEEEERCEGEKRGGKTFEGTPARDPEKGSPAGRIDCRP